MADRNKDALLTLFSLTLLILSTYPGYELFIYIFTLPLYFLFKDVGLKKSAAIGLGYGAVFAFVYLSWLTRMETPNLYISGIILNGMFYSLCFLSASWVALRWKHHPVFPGLAFGYCYVIVRTVVGMLPSIGYLRTFLSLGYPPSMFDWLLPWLGSSSADFLIIQTGFFLGYLLRTQKGKAVALFIAALLSCSVANGILLRADRSPTKKIRAGLIQGNFNWVWDERVARTDQMFRYFEKTIITLAKKGTNLVVLPEYALPVDILHEASSYAERLAALAMKYKTVIVIGTLEKVSHQPLDLQRWIGYDTTLIFDPKKILLEPYRAIYPISENVIRGSRPLIHKTGVGDVTILSCFEVLYERFVLDYTRSERRPDYFITVANDQLFDHTRAGTNLERYLRRLAIITRTPLLYVSNTGPTVAYDATGNVIARAPQHMRETVALTISYTPARDSFASYAEFLFIIFLTSTVIASFKLSRSVDNRNSSTYHKRSYE